MTKYFCHNCKCVVCEDELDSVEVYSQTWDSPAEYEWRCPICGSEEVEVADTCELCGEPIDPDRPIHFCEECESDLDYYIGQISEALSRDLGIPQDKARQALFEFIAEKY